MVLHGGAKRPPGLPARPSLRAGVAGAEKLVNIIMKDLSVMV